MKKQIMDDNAFRSTWRIRYRINEQAERVLQSIFWLNFRVNDNHQGLYKQARKELEDAYKLLILILDKYENNT